MLSANVRLMVVITGSRQPYAQSYAAGAATGHDSGWHVVRQRGRRSSVPSKAGSDMSVDRLPLFNHSNPTAVPQISKRVVTSDPGTATETGERDKRRMTKAKAKAGKSKSVGASGHVLEGAEKSLGLQRPSRKQTHQRHQPQAPRSQQGAAPTTAAPRTVPESALEPVATTDSVLTGLGQPRKAV